MRDAGPAMNEMLRSFIAVPVPTEMAGRLGELQDRLRPVAGNVKWVDPEACHITLKFLGEVPRARLDATWAAVTESLAGAAGFGLRLHGVGVFPTRMRARVIWVGATDGKRELADLATRTERACTAQGFAAEARPFQAHATLGRVREPLANPGLAAALEELVGAEVGEITVDRVLLMRSELSSKGSRYTVQAEHMLEPRA
jgi:RNA 2',3'-cyclic 3'-phosphodiesterase